MKGLSNNTTTSETLIDEFISQFKLSSKRLFWSGVVLTLLGLLALIAPAISSLTIELMLGWLILFSGMISFFYAFSYKGAGPFFGALLTSLLTIALGVVMLFRPGIGLVALTLIIAGLFIVDGAFKMAMAIELRKIKGWIWLLLSSIASFVLGTMIAAGIPSSSLYTIGILVGINFLMSGISLIFISQSVKKITEELPQ